MNGFSPILLRAGLRYMLRHRWQGLLAITGIALGVAVVLAVDLANSGARAAFELSAQQLQGRATHRLVVPGATLPDEVYVSLQRTPGAPPMAPVVKGWVGVDGLPGRYQLVGFDLFVESPFRGELGRVANRAGFTADWLTEPGALVLSETLAQELGVSQGSTLNILYRGTPATLRVLHIESSKRAPADTLLVDIATAKSVMALDGRLSHVDLILDDDQEQWVRQRIPAGVELQTVAEQAQGVTRLSAAFELNLTESAGAAGRYVSYFQCNDFFNGAAAHPVRAAACHRCHTARTVQPDPAGSRDPGRAGYLDRIVTRCLAGPGIDPAGGGHRQRALLQR